VFDAVKCGCCGSTFQRRRMCRDNTGKPCCPACGNHLPGEEIPDVPFEPITGCKALVSCGVESVTLTFIRKEDDEVLTSISLSVDEAELLGSGILDSCLVIRVLQAEEEHEDTEDKPGSGSLRRLIERMRP